jgi:ABC-type multidrug transport system ATPase subunit
MSEEILKALMQLFAIIARQDVGLSLREREFVESFLKQQLSESSVNEYLRLFDGYVEQEGKTREENDGGEVRLTSVRDSVKILGIAKKINRTLTQKQKVVVLIRLLELINSDQNFTSQRMAIIDTTSEVFNISKQEYKAISGFIIREKSEELDMPEILISQSQPNQNTNSQFIQAHQLSGTIIILRVQSVDLYFLKYNGYSDLFLNGLPLKAGRIYNFANGSVIKQPIGKPIFYTDVVAKFISDSVETSIFFNVENVNHTFSNGCKGLENINLQEISGKMVAIMGNSGSGKTTLLNVLSGIENPTQGEVNINGINVHSDKEKIKGVIGFIPQDDLLIEELTVYENLFYSSMLVFRDHTKLQITEKVDRMLTSLGLYHIRNLKVGSPINKKISGGQRKRLNIGLELIREPSVLFVDEPTSGLSSRDSENVMELLRELTVRGKLIFVVIHQPSSEIFKMFDKVIILDDGGVQIYYGNPVEAAIYFKKIDNQINSDVGECPKCGNVNPEAIFNIIESQIVDEYGRTTGTRKVQPEEWARYYENIYKPENPPQRKTELPGTLMKQGWWRQLNIYFRRDISSKLANKQYILLNLLEAPILAFLLAYIIKYIDDPTSGVYIFRENANIMPYLFMCTIVALFTGLIVSAEEIFKDRKILKRESFLNLSRSSYLISKINILFLISAIQAILFIWVGNSVLGIKGMHFEYWLVFFSVAALANIIGLNISSAFNSAVTIYIIIPFLIIPQMVLTGAMFSFDRINYNLGGGREKVPVIAEIMPSRWAFEALAVNQFMSNNYEKHFYDLRKLESAFNFKNVYYIPELRGYVESYKSRVYSGDKNPIKEADILLLLNEITKENNSVYAKHHQILFEGLNNVSPDNFNLQTADALLSYLDQLEYFYSENFKKVNEAIDREITEMVGTPEKRKEYQQWYDEHYNTHLASFVKNTYAPLPLVRLGDKLVQKIDPIYLDPSNKSLYGFRSHFLAPNKNIAGKLVSTFYFNIAILWFFAVIAYIALYFDVLKKTLLFFERNTGIRQSLILENEEKFRIKSAIKKPVEHEKILSNANCN